MDEQANSCLPPYPTIGEICQLLSAAFDTKAADRGVRKKLDRLAREGDFDWTLRSEVIGALLVDPLKTLDPEFSDFILSFVEFHIEEHISLLSSISLDAMTREQALPMLTEAFYAGIGANFLIWVHHQFGGPDLGRFLMDGVNPIDVVFSWAEALLGIDIPNTISPDEKIKRDDIGRWRRGDTIPSFYGSILPIKRELIERLASSKRSKIDLFLKWLVTARVMAWLEREAIKSGRHQIRACARREILLNCPKRDIGIELSIANRAAAEDLRELSGGGLRLLEAKLARTSSKEIDDQKLSRNELDHFKTLAGKLDREGRTQYFENWCEGRWHVLAGQEKEALQFYENAANQALYRAGKNQKQILEEAIVLAAHLNAKTAVKRLKHRGLAMRLFSDELFRSVEQAEVVADWEMEQLARTYGSMFPVSARFKEVQKTKLSMSSPFLAFNQSETDTMKPGLANPDRVISIPLYDGSKLRKPQLVWYASENRSDEVRQLLDAGANVNKLDAQGGSALLNALQCAADGRGREVLDLLLQAPHDRNTLNNQTARKRLSPLYLAVQLGDPEVVAKLLEMGADADMQAGYPPQSALYLCVSRFSYYREAWFEKQLLRHVAFPRSADREVYRRYLGGFAGAMGDRLQLQDLAPRDVEIMKLVVDVELEKIRAVPRENFLKIAKLLLLRGANPNLKHSSPGPGRTPLMLAAENDALDAYRLMTDAGGDPSISDDQGNDCYALAVGFGCPNVLRELQKRFQ